MKLYLVERTDEGGYDTYSDFVCWAKDAEEARYTAPDPEYHIWKDGAWHYSYGKQELATYHGWVDDPKTLKVWELSRPPEKPTVVCASFHAG